MLKGEKIDLSTLKGQMIFTEMDLVNAYIGGLFDGEGCLFIAKTKPPIKPRTYNGKRGIKYYYEKNPRYNIYAQISMTDYNAVKRIHEYLGGQFRQEIKPQKPNYGLRYTWRCPQGQLKEFLLRIKPYCVVKESEIQIALIYLESHTGRKRNFRNPLTKEELFDRESLYNMMKLLKKPQFKERLYVKR